MTPSSPPLCHLTWQTPVGLMRAALTALGVRVLYFPDQGEILFPIPGLEREPVLLLRERLEGKDAFLGDCQDTADALTGFLRRYFEGEPQDHSPRLDWSGYGEFDLLVWRAVARIPFGQTQTYGEMAQSIGQPGASRAVGGALSRNPLPLLVPCHRVVSQATGSRHWGGFSGGLDLKKWLLAHEGQSPQIDQDLSS